MLPLSIASSLYGLTSLFGNQSGTSTATDSSDFSSSLAVKMASLQAQSVNSLLGSVFGTDTANATSTTSSSFDFLTNTLPASSATTGLSITGRNLSLFDPESAYRMMSVINTKDVSYKAQYSELSAMENGVATMEQASQTLGNVSGSMSNEEIKTQLQAFTDSYNAWIKRFDSTVQDGGVLDGTQAAEISLHELEQSVENPFNGAGNGFHGLSDLGVSINQNTNLASIDTEKLDAALSSDKEGAVSTIQQFSGNFTQSAELLTSANNFIANRLNNLDRVIDYIGDNKSSLQAEFGLGDTAKPSAQVAKALAAYNQIFGS